MHGRQGTWTARSETEAKRMHAAGMLKYDPHKGVNASAPDIKLPKDYEMHKNLGHVKICEAMEDAALAAIASSPVQYNAAEFNYYMFNGTRYQDRLESDPWEDAQSSALYRLDWERWWWKTQTVAKIQTAWQLHKVIKTVCNLMCHSWPTEARYRGVLAMPTPLEMEKAGHIIMSIPKDEFRK
jgi:hypothetical protein